MTPSRLIDLRSDTVTRPTAAMRRKSIPIDTEDFAVQS